LFEVESLVSSTTLFTEVNVVKLFKNSITGLSERLVSCAATFGAGAYGNQFLAVC
jgi:hypothetical protein